MTIQRLQNSKIRPNTQWRADENSSSVKSGESRGCGEVVCKKRFLARNFSIAYGQLKAMESPQEDSEFDLAHSRESIKSSSSSLK